MGEVGPTESEFRVSTDPATLDVDVIHKFLSEEAYWCLGIPRETVESAIENSLCFGGYVGDDQVAFARVVTDFATFGYLADVFVLPSHRGKGYSKLLIKTVMEHPRLQGLRRFYLVTRDAHGLYEQFGFSPPKKPGGAMEIRRDNPYR